MGIFPQSLYNAINPFSLDLPEKCLLHPQAPLVLVLLLLVSGVLCVYLAAWAQARRRQPGALEFGLLAWAIAIYSLGYAVEISRTNLTDVLWAIRIEYLGLAFLPALMLIFTLRFVRNRPVHRAVVSGLLAISFITLGLVWTVEHHSLYYISPRLEPGDYFPVLIFERGLWYRVHLSYMLLTGSISPLLLFWYARRVESRRRSQMALLGLGALIPIVVTFFYAAGKTPYGIDSGPLALSITVLFFWLALFRFELFQIVPAARELALDAVRDAFVVLDHSLRILDMNHAARNLPEAAGWKIGQPFPRQGSLGEFAHYSLQRPGGELEFSAVDENGGLRHFKARSYPLKNVFGQTSGSAILISDVSETTRLIQHLDEQASTDELTGLLNRRSLMQWGAKLVEQSAASGAPLGVVMLDLDHFKEINDTFGHKTGDEVLRCVAQCLHSGLRQGDVLGRYGGDEFVVFLPGVEFGGAMQIAERLRALICACRMSGELSSITISASCGVFVSQAGQTTCVDDFLRQADLALYRAKGGGRNQAAV